MTEIRPIREHEAEPFLRLLCETFQIDFNRAYDAFFGEPLFDLRRKWAMFEGPQIVSALQTVPLAFGWGNAIGIAGVCTVPSRRREGLAGRLLERVLRESERNGEGPALLFARELALYERMGFVPLDRVIRAPLPQTARAESKPVLSFDQVRAKYDQWSSEHPDRLRRNDARWRYWNWHYRICEGFGDGYVCAEPNGLREGIWTPGDEPLPFSEGTEWFGTTLMADHLGFVFEKATVELYLMGHNVPGVPQMFLTDQF